MPDLALELAHLALTERHIVDAELCVSRQRMLVARMRGVGGACPERVVLARFEETLAAFNRHRRMILDSIDALMRPPSSST